MKIIYGIYFLIFIGLFITCNAKGHPNKSDAADAGNDKNEKSLEKPVIQMLDSVNYDFGNIKAGDTIKHTFHFTNSGKMPLFILNVANPCACVLAEYKTHPVEHDMIDSFVIIYASIKEARGFQNKEIEIFYNSSLSPQKINMYGRAY